MRAGVEGWLHVPVRDGDVVDDEIVGIVKDRIASNDRPVMWITPSLITVLDEHARAARGRPGSTIRCCGRPIRRSRSRNTGATRSRR